MNEMRKGDWIQTASGGRFYPLDPRPDEVRLSDIAAALSKLCRFTGHCRRFWSVAQHSVLVASQLPAELALWGLLHDAAEAYIGDISRPLKRDLYALEPALGAPGKSDARHVSCVEAAIMEAVAEHFDLPPRPDWRAIKRADDVALATECRDLMAPLDPDWSRWLGGVTPLPGKLWPTGPGAAEVDFLRAFEFHGGKEEGR